MSFLFKFKRRLVAKPFLAAPAAAVCYLLSAFPPVCNVAAAVALFGRSGARGAFSLAERGFTKSTLFIPAG